MKQWFSESMNHWINQTTNQWINEPADQPLKQTMNKSSNESLNHWTNESINQWLNESAATYLGYLCSDLPPSQLTSSLRAAVTMRLATSSCNPPCHRPTQHHWCFPARSRANAFCHSRLQPPHSRSAAPDRSMFAQRWHWDFDRTNPALLWFPHFFLQFFCEILRGCQFFNILTCKSSSRYSPVHFLSAIFAKSTPELAETETLLRRPRKPLYPTKHRVSRLRMFSPGNSHGSELLHFQTTWWWVVDMMMWLTWCHDNRP